MEVSIISHNYLNKENSKKLIVLGEKVRLEVISPNSMSGAMFSYRYKKNIRINELSSIRFYRKLSFPLLPFQYFLFSASFNFRKFRPDIIHIEYDPWNLIFLQTLFIKTLFRRKTPIICTIKQNTYTEYGFFITKIKDLIGKRCVKKVNCFIAISRKAASLYMKRFNVSSEKFVYSALFGVDVDLFKPCTQERRKTIRGVYKLPENSFTIGYVGRFDRVKGVETLVGAIKKARESSGADLHLAFIGGGNSEDFLLKESKNNDWLHVLPKASREKVADFLKTLDIFVMPSHITEYHEEHDGIALLEAMSTGLPCIGTNSGIIPEILEDNGIIVKAGDEDGLSSEILKLFYDKELRKKLGLLGRKTIMDKYSVESVASRHYEAYKRAYKESKSK